MNYADWQASGKTVRIGGREVFLREAGAGPTLLFLHGFPTTSYDFAGVIDRLAGRFRCVSFDFAGFGRSAPPLRWSYDEQTDLAVVVARQMGVQRAVVVAHDYGVSVAQELIARQGERAGVDPAQLQVAGVVFLNGGIDPRLHRPLLVQRLLASPLGAILSPWIVSKKIFTRSLARIIVRTDCFDVNEHWEAVSRFGALQRAHHQLHYIAERKRRGARWLEAYRDRRVPVALAWGEQDPVAGAHVLAWARVERPDAEIEAMAVGHYPQLESVDRTADLIGRFAARFAG